MGIIAYDLKTEDGDFIFEDGDFRIEDSNQEHANAIMVSNLGEWKQVPDLGIGIDNFLNGAGVTEAKILEQNIRRQFKQDGFKTQDLKIDFNLSTSKLIVKTNAIRLR